MTTLKEAFDSLTGFDEIAIQRAFGEPISEVRQNATMGYRALIFVQYRRDGQRDQAAYQAAMELPLKQALDYFDPDPEDDLEESGKEPAPSS